MKTIKHFMILAATVLVAVSCSNSEFTDDGADNSAISFGTFSYTQSKAAVAPGPLMKDFGVFGVYKPTSGTNSLLFNDQKLVYDDKDATWGQFTYSPQKYWPTSGSVDFYAYHPYRKDQDQDATFDLTSATATSLDTEVQYTLSKANTANSSPQEDFMYAEVLGKSKGSGKVQFVFNHKLSKLTFDVSDLQSNLENVIFGPTTPTGTQAVTITSIEISDLYCSDNFKLQGGTWSGKYKTAYATDTQTFNVPTVNAPSIDSGYIIVLPQVVESTSNITISVSINYGDGSDEQEYKVVIPIGAGTANAQKWDEGKNYIFDIDLTKATDPTTGKPVFEVIEFEARVVDWNNETITPIFPVTQPSFGAINAVDSGGTVGVATGKLVVDQNWDWSAAPYTFAGLGAGNASFTLNVANVTFGTFNIALKLPAGYTATGTTGVTAAEQTFTISNTAGSVTIARTDVLASPDATTINAYDEGSENDMGTRHVYASQTWDWSGAAYTFDNLATLGNKFTLKFSDVTFHGTNSISIKVPAGYNVYLDGTPGIAQTIVTSGADVIIEKK